jgi:hypothetical protein
MKQANAVTNPLYPKFNVYPKHIVDKQEWILEVALSDQTDTCPLMALS